MENSHRKGCPNFKLKVDDWDIPFPEVLRIYEWIGKSISIGENGINPSGSLPVPQNIGLKGTDDISFLPMYKSIYIISEWTPETKVLILSLLFTIALFLIFWDLCWYHSQFPQYVADNSHSGYILVAW